MNSDKMWYCVALYSEIYGVGGSERTRGEIDSEKAAASLQIMILREDWRQWWPKWWQMC
jgi:hypothetical protein